MRWYPFGEEVQYWPTAKEHDFSLRETQGLRVNVKQWKEKYIYTNMHKLFFVEFPCLLYEWMKKKTARNCSLWLLKPVVWDQATLDRMKVLGNKWTWVIDLWFS
jgi:hypothetical protein